jgi:homoserine dehydrogenase
MEQEVLAPGEGPEGAARLIFITHAAREADLQATLHELGTLDAVRSVGSVLRVVGQR